MVITVGNEAAFEDLVTSLILLEQDAIAAYESAITCLSDTGLAGQVDAFRQDHLDHLHTLTEMARTVGLQMPTQGDMKHDLTIRTIDLADLIGDSAILKAMTTNEDDTITAYGRAASHPDVMPRSRAFFEKALADEMRHRDWMRRTAEAL